MRSSHPSLQKNVQKLIAPHDSDQRIRATPLTIAMFVVLASCLDMIGSRFKVVSAFPQITRLPFHHSQRTGLSRISSLVVVTKIPSITAFRHSDDSTRSMFTSSYPRTNFQKKFSRPRIGMSKEPLEEEDTSDQVAPTWTYKPYEPSRSPNLKGNRRLTRRFYSTKDENWVVPNKITIPESKLDISFTRSSGAGGQNVNKVSTQAEVRFNVMGAEWIPREVRERICQNDGNRINKEGVITISSQEHRTQIQNRKTAMDKIQEIVLQNYPRPKKRKMRKGISKKKKEINKEQKRLQSRVKENRKKVDF